MGLSGNSSIGLVAWIRDLTYREIHAFVLGFALGLYVVSTGDVATLSKYLGFALGVTKAGDALRRKADYTRRQILREGWYLTGGVPFGLLVGYLL